MIDREIETKGEIVDEGQDHGQEALEIAEVMVVVEETDIIEEGKTCRYSFVDTVLSLDLLYLFKLLLSLYPRSRIETTLTVHERHYLEHFIFTSFRSPSPPRRRKKRYRNFIS